MTKHRDLPASQDAGHFTWDVRTTTRVGLWSTLASAATGILLAIFEVQEWKVPTPVAITLIVLLSAFVVASASMVVYEISKAIREFLEHRATSASWVSAEKPGLLDYEADGIRAMDRFTREMTKLAKDTQGLGKKMDDHRRRMDRGSHWSGRKKQRLANRTAKDIDKSAAFIEKRIALLKALIRDVFRNYEGLVAVALPETREDYDAVAELQTTLSETRLVSGESADSSAGYRDSVRDLEAQNVSRSVRMSSKRLGDALAEVVDVLRQYERRAGKLILELEKKTRRPE